MIKNFGITILLGISALTSSAQTVEEAPTTNLSPTATHSKWASELESRIKLNGYIQAGLNYTHNSETDYSTFDIKRAILWADAQITDRWSFRFMHDFSSVVQEFYTDYQITNNKALTLRFGQFKNGLSYENPLSPTSMETIDVYAESITFLTGCGSDPLMGVQYGRDLGIAIFGETKNKCLRYELNIMNGQGINTKDGNAYKDFIGKLEWRPIKGLNLIASGQIGRGHAIATSPYNPEIKVGDNYKRNRWTAGFNYESTHANIHGEYLEGKDGNATSRGAYITGCVPFKRGVIDLIGSYDYFDFNTSLNMAQHKAVAGVQYWFYKKCRLQMQYVYKSAMLQNGIFKHGDNHSIMCQMQVRL